MKKFGGSMAGLDWLVQDGALGGMFKVWGVGRVVVLQAWNRSWTGWPADHGDLLDR